MFEKGQPHAAKIKGRQPCWQLACSPLYFLAGSFTALIGDSWMSERLAWGLGGMSLMSKGLEGPEQLNL